MNNPFTTYLFGFLLFVFGIIFVYSKKQHRDNSKYIFKKICDSIELHVPIDYFSEIKGITCFQMSTRKNIDFVSLTLQDILKQNGYTVVNHSQYKESGFEFIFENTKHVHLCEVYREINQIRPGYTYWVKII